MFLKILGFSAGLVGIFWMALAGGWAVWWYDRRPINEPAWAQVNFLWFHWQPPESLGAALGALQADEAAAANRVVAVKAAQAQVTSAAASQEKAAQAQIRVVYRDIIKEVPAYVPPASDMLYPLSAGWVRVHDAAAWGVDPGAVPLPAGQFDDSPSGVLPSAAVAVIAANYADCRADAAQLAALQGWIRGVREASQPLQTPVPVP